MSQAQATALPSFRQRRRALSRNMSGPFLISLNGLPYRIWAASSSVSGWSEPGLPPPDGPLVTQSFAEPLQPSRVAGCDWGVVGVGVALPALWVGGVEDWVEADEAAGGGVVLAGAQMGEAGGVGGAVDEAAGGGPGGLAAAGVAERVALAPGDAEVAGVDG